MIETLVSDLTDVRLWIIVLSVTAIGLVEKLAIFRAGQSTAKANLSNLPGVTKERRARIEEMFQNRGSYILLLASIPGIGAAISAVAGNLGVSSSIFVLFVFISTLVRNWMIVILSGQLTLLF